MIPKFHRFFAFNPDNEMAIANGSPYYMPPANIVKMAEDLSYLPAYFSDEDDVVWVQKLPEKTFTESRKRIFNIQPFLYTGREEPLVVEEFQPWGWSPRMFFLLQHLNAGKWKKEWKELYSRRTAGNCLQSLCKELPFIEKEVLPLECQNLSELAKATQDGIFLVKAPWSSSGRGLLRINREGLTVKSKEWLRGMLKKQGYLMVEKEQKRLVDFAMEFYVEKQSVKFIGLSCFTTGSKGEYMGNYLGNQRELETRLTAWIERGKLERVKTELIRVLQAKIASAGYSGYLGVDMMIYRNSAGEDKIQPCLEINLRYTMGILALFLSERFVAEGSEGLFRIVHHTSDGEALQWHNTEVKQFPLVCDGKQIVEGYAALTPVLPDTRFIAYMKVRRK